MTALSGCWGCTQLSQSYLSLYLVLAQHSGARSLRGELLWPLGKLLLACEMASLGTGRKQPAPSGLKIAEHYGHTLVFEGKT